MKRAVIRTGGKQYLVSEGDVLDVELVNADKDIVNFTPLLVTDGKDTKVGTPEVKEATVKVTAIRFKAKKRVHKVHGHKQSLSRIEITTIN
jgi:large subunit ribosomal protein L21